MMQILPAQWAGPIAVAVLCVDIDEAKWVYNVMRSNPERDRIAYSVYHYAQPLNHTHYPVNIMRNQALFLVCIV
jgi:hypothetical protein